MPRQIKDFGTPERADDSQGIEFALAGQLFHTLPDVPAGVLDDVMAGASIIEGGAIRFNQVSILRFFRGTLLEHPHLDEAGQPCSDDVARFDQCVRSKEVIIRLELLGEIFMYCASELTGRPTGPLSASSAGSGPTGRTSAGDLPWLAPPGPGSAPAPT